MKKIAAIVITYHPDIDAFKRNLCKYAPYVDKIIVWQNSHDDLKLNDIDDKIILAGNGQNRFIATPLNYAIDWCVRNGFDYLLTMDQDSTWDNFGEFVKKTMSQNDSRVAIYAPNVNNLFASTAPIEEAESVITSGSLLNINIASKLGGFREDYKIYWVDGEYCCWARKNGYKINIITNNQLVQQFGKETKTIFGFIAANYSATVYYFLFRNMLWMKREYKNTPSLRCILYTTMFYTRGVVLGEKNKTRKIISILKGLLIGMFCRIPNKRTKS